MIFNVEVNEFHDMQIIMDSNVDNAIKTTSPGRNVKFTVNITNNGNVPDTPSLNNHTTQEIGDDDFMSETPGMGALAGSSVEWRQLVALNTEITQEQPCTAVDADETIFQKTSAWSSLTADINYQEWMRMKPLRWSLS